MKLCTKCRTEQVETEFYPSKKSKDGRQGWCRSCVRSWQLENRESMRAQQRAKYASTPDLAERKRKWRQANPDKVRSSRLKERYGITLDEYEALLAVQGGVCAVCRKDPGKKCLVVDHDHATGKVRGLLHHGCNAALGLLGEDAQAAEGLVSYLRRHKEVA